jgi:hypothetical protein
MNLLSTWYILYHWSEVGKGEDQGQKYIVHIWSVEIGTDLNGRQRIQSNESPLRLSNRGPEIFNNFHALFWSPTEI